MELAALDRLKKSFNLRTILMTCWLSGERSLPFGELIIIIIIIIVVVVVVVVVVVKTNFM